MKTIRLIAVLLQVVIYASVATILEVFSVIERPGGWVIFGGLSAVTIRFIDDLIEIRASEKKKHELIFRIGLRGSDEN